MYSQTDVHGQGTGGDTQTFSLDPLTATIRAHISLSAGRPAAAHHREQCHPRLPPTAPAWSWSARSSAGGGASRASVIEALLERGRVKVRRTDAEQPIVLQPEPQSRAERHHRPHHRRGSPASRTSSRSSATPRCRSTTAARISSAPRCPRARACSRSAWRHPRWVTASEWRGHLHLRRLFDGGDLAELSSRGGRRERHACRERPAELRWSADVEEDWLQRPYKAEAMPT